MLQILQAVRKRIRVYVNRVQKAFIKARQKTRVWIGGRGSGKTTVIGDLIKVMFSGSKAMEIPSMAGAKVYLLAATYDQAITKIIPEIQNRLEKHGLKEYISDNEPGHYVMYRKPPEWFGKPRKKVKKYEKLITFINGFTIEILSFDSHDNRRGGSYDAGIIDEAALIDWDKYEKSILPLTRGNIREWNHPWRSAIFMFTSRAWKSKGKWVETKMKKLAADYPDDYYFVESSARDNIAVLGEEYFEKNKREMNPLTYAVEIENKPIERIPDCYYQFLDDEMHTYTARYDMVHVGNQWKITSEKDKNLTLPLDISFDFNNKFTSATIWQEFLPGFNDGSTGLDSGVWELRCLRNMWIQWQHIDILVEDICRQYESHPTKEVNVFGGKDGHNKLAQISNFTLYELIAKKFRELGWECWIRVDLQYADVEHKLKHAAINSVLRENDTTLPVVRINDENAKEVFQSMGMAPTTDDFKKDKSSESDEQLDQQYATHLSDTVDNYVFPKSRGQIATRGYKMLEVFSA